MRPSASRSLFRDPLQESMQSYRRWRSLFNIFMLLALVVFVSTSVYFFTLPPPPAAAKAKAGGLSTTVSSTSAASLSSTSPVSFAIASSPAATSADASTTTTTTTTAVDDLDDASNDGDSPSDGAGDVYFTPLARERQAAVVEAFRHAWSAYRQHAWTWDEIEPVSGRGSNAWGGLGATLVDALDTLWLMGLRADFNDAREWVATKFVPKSSDWDGSVFEVTIRYIGGLLAAYELSDDRVFLDKAEEVAITLLPAFNTPSGLAYTTINLKTGHATNPSWNGRQCVLSEFGTLGLEWRALAKYTGKQIYRDKVDHIAHHLAQRTRTGLLPTFWNPSNGEPSNGHLTYGARGDSYYEYLLKQWIQSGHSDAESKRLYDLAISDTVRRLVKRTKRGNLAYLVEMDHESIINKMDELACFFGGMLSLSGDDTVLPLAKDIAHTCWLMFNTTATGLAPEIATFVDGADNNEVVAQAAHNLLRPETMETLFYLWRRTHDDMYRERAWRIFQSWNTHARVQFGFSGINDVNQMPPHHNNRQESFFFAETLKYAFLIFSPEQTLSLDEFVLNTEAHPMRIWK
jgi:mannosyl-oligosaccharide alpha-1,2-mannosidase